MSPPRVYILIGTLMVALLLAGQPALTLASGFRAEPALQATLLLSAFPNWEADGGQAGAEFGTAVATAGDVNGDGFDDVIVGASKYSSKPLELSQEGAALIFFGSRNGLQETADWIASGASKGSAFGKAVAAAGDVNGDGRADVIVGAPNHKYTGADGKLKTFGAAYLYHGGSQAMDNHPDWQVVGTINNSDFGYAVGRAGDVDGDGFDDVLVGARWYGVGGTAFLYTGSKEGLNLEPAWTYASEQSGANLGAAVGTAGDVNGDGFSDVLVSAPLYSNGQTDEGVVFVFYGSTEGLQVEPDLILESNRAEISFGFAAGTAGDVNGDGYDDVLVSAPQTDDIQLFGGMAFAFYGSKYGLSPSANWIVQSDQLNARFGWAAGSAGDVDQDGYADVVVGAHLYNYDNDDQSLEGAVFVYQGGSGGLSTTVNWVAHDNKGYTTEFGIATGTAGDVNNDGCADLIVGAPSYKLYTNEVVGKVFVYHGTEANSGSQIQPRVYLPMIWSTN